MTKVVKKTDNLFITIRDFFASVKLSVVTFLLIAAGSMVGTLIPQGKSLETYMEAYGEFFFRLFYGFGLLDIYHALWFRMLLFLLLINIFVCSAVRIKAAWKRAFRSGKPDFERLTESKSCRRFDSPKGVHELVESCKRVFVKSFPFAAPSIEDAEKGTVIFAEKRRWSGLGAYVVHLSLIFLTVGALLGSMAGFEGFAMIPEGGSANSVKLKQTDEEKPLPFEIRCDDFDVTFYKTGSPKEYRSDLTIMDGGTEVLKKSIIVNDPLRYKGINIFQSSYGMLPPEKVTLHFKTKEDLLYHKDAKVGEEVEMPESSGTFVVRDFTDSYGFAGRNLGPAFLVEIKPKGGEKQLAVIPLNFERFDMMRKGDFVISAGHYEERYYTGLQITRDPGVPFVYAGFFTMIAGCFIVFFLPHRRFMIRLVPSGSGTRVYVAGWAARNRVSMEIVAEKTVERLKALEEGD